MSYLMLIMERADRRNGRSSEQAATEWERMIAYAGSLMERGVLESAQSYETDGERITRIHVQRNPEKLARLAAAFRGH